MIKKAMKGNYFIWSRVKTSVVKLINSLCVYEVSTIPSKDSVLGL